jgi:hypothetical protein
MQFMAEWADAWDDWEVEAEDFIDAGERVVVILNQRGRSKATGIPVDAANFGLISIYTGAMGFRDAALLKGIGSEREV